MWMINVTRRQLATAGPPIHSETIEAFEKGYRIHYNGSCVFGHRLSEIIARQWQSC